MNGITPAKHFLWYSYIAYPLLEFGKLGKLYVIASAGPDSKPPTSSLCQSTPDKQIINVD